MKKLFAARTRPAEPTGSAPVIAIPLSSTPLVRSGFPIARGRRDIEGRGTAGLVVRKVGTTTGAQLLTCAHVLGFFDKGTDPAATDRKKVYSPEYKECELLQCDCNKPIGSILEDGLHKRGLEYNDKTFEAVLENQMVIGSCQFAVDAALVNLENEVFAYNRLNEVGQIQDVRDLILEWGLNALTPPPSYESTEVEPLPKKLPNAIDVSSERQIVVKKVGATTKLTVGRIRRLAWREVRISAAKINYGLGFEIEADASSPPYSNEYEVDLSRHVKKDGTTKTITELRAELANDLVSVSIGGSTKTPTLKIVSHTFAQPGDSGSPIVDEQQRVVGIVQGGFFRRLYVTGTNDHVSVSAGNTQAIFIRAALDKLGVSFLKSGFHAAGSRILVPGMAVDRGHLDWSAATELFAGFEATPVGARIATIARLHWSEVRHLVHHRRRVMVTWHRFKGPAFLVAFARAAQQPSLPTPTTIDGIRLVDTLRAMRDALTAEGSSALRSSIAEHQAEILAWAENTSNLLAFAGRLAGLEETRGL